MTESISHGRVRVVKRPSNAGFALALTRPDKPWHHQWYWAAVLVFVPIVWFYAVWVWFARLDTGERLLSFVAAVVIFIILIAWLG